MKTFRMSTALLFAFGLAIPSAYAELVLSLNRTIAIPDLGHVGDLAFDAQSGNLWIVGETEDRAQSSEAAIIEWDLTNDQEVSWFDPAAVLRHPTALAVHPTTGNLFVFGYNLVSEPGDDDPKAVWGAAEFTQTGILVASLDIGDSSSFGGATFDGPDSLLVKAGGGRVGIVDQSTGAITPVFVNDGFDVDMDPVTGSLLFFRGGPFIQEIDLATGEELGRTEISNSLLGLGGWWASTFAVNASGDQLVIGANSGSPHGHGIAVLDRLVVPEPSTLALFLLGLAVWGIATRRGTER